MPFEIIRQDITRMHTDAIVNAANSALSPGGGVCGAIFRAAGLLKLTGACMKLGSCETGSAVITPGFNLPAKYVIHAVGPKWKGGQRGEEALLAGAYLSSLRLAQEHECQSIAFPLISSGIYGYPKDQALAVAVGAIRTFLEHNDMQVYLVLFDRDSLTAGQSRFSQLRSFIDDRYVDAHYIPRERSEARFAMPMAESLEESAYMPSAAPVMAAPKRSLSDLLNRMDETFSRMLLRLIDEKGMTDVEVYKRANLDRKLFSKLRKDGYNPSKPTVLALAIALELNLDQTKDFLARAGFALSPSSKFDVIIEYYITNGIYDIYEINEALFAFDQRLLSAS